MTGETPRADAVLVVDDDDDIRTSVAEILRGQGYAVSEAENGERALDLVQHRRFAAVVLDLRMPRCDGVAVLDALDAPPPVVVMSSHRLARADAVRLQGKIAWYLEKPFPPRRLIDAVAGSVKAAGGES